MPARPVARRVCSLNPGLEQRRPACYRVRDGTTTLLGAAGVLFVASVSVRAAVFLILELDGPLTGVVRISPDHCGMRCR
jgi:hypothetical protein